MNGKRRILFRIPTCPFCIRAEEELRKAGVAYETIDINPNDRGVVQLLSGQPTVPILVEVVGCDQQDDDIVSYIEELRVRRA
jgi:glutaredoxin